MTLRESPNIHESYLLEIPTDAVDHSSLVHLESLCLGASHGNFEKIDRSSNHFSRA